MRPIWCCLLVLAVTACSTPSHKVATPTDSAAVNQTAEADLSLAAYVMRERLVDACRERAPSTLGAAVLPGASNADLPSCFREKITAAFANSDGVKQCAEETDLADYVMCVAYGDWLNMIRHNAGSPKELSPGEWHDHVKAVDATANEVGIQALVQCAGKTAQQTEACQVDLLVKSLGATASDVTSCGSKQEFKCLATRGISQYLRDKALLIW